MKGENVLLSGAFGTKRLFQQSILKTHEWVNSTLQYMTFKRHMTDKITEPKARCDDIKIFLWINEYTLEQYF